MSTLTLVRHGQAEAFLRRDSALSATGEAQAAKLAHFWLSNGIRFDEACCGTLSRQARTEAAVAQHFQDAGQHWPGVVRDAAWNEYDAAGVLDHLVPGDAHLSALAAGFEQARGSVEENRHFQRMLSAAMKQWLEGSTSFDGVESWPAFRARISGAIQRLMAGKPGRRVVVFTSGGPIGFTVHCAMQAPAQTFLDVNWRVRNTSITQFLFDSSRLTLDCFNAIPHLDEAALWTYR